ncbi:MAG: hypothetical protein HZB38_02555 [Planctomycetes bacterium]|nr:hypothetical protein [Planctomycetota bacterium]
MIALNAGLGWLLITLGFASGTLIGLFFHRENWLGGYDSWRRRLLRLGHIAAVALGMLNVLFALSARHVQLSATDHVLCIYGFALGGVSMPTVCALSAWRKPMRHLFFIPVASLLTAGITFSSALFRGGITP